MRQPISDKDLLPPRSHEQRRIDELNAELATANKTLAGGGLDFPVEVVERALLRKTTIEWIFAERDRKHKEAEYEAERKEAEDKAERQRFLEQLEADPALRREVERRNRSDEWDRKIRSKKLERFGRLPDSFPDDFRVECFGVRDGFLDVGCL